MSDPQTTQPPPPDAQAPAESKASGLMRALAAVVALVLLFGVAVMVFVVINPDNLPLCDDVISGEAALGPANECLDSSRAAYTASRVAAAAAGLVGALAALVGFYVAATGRRGGLMVKLTGAALVLGGLTFLIGEL